MTSRVRALASALGVAAVLLAGCSSGPDAQEISDSLQDADVPAGIADCIAEGAVDADLADDTLDALADGSLEDEDVELPAEDEAQLDSIASTCAAGG